MSEHGSLSMPAGWELRTQEMWYEPERRELEPRMAVHKSNPMRANIVVNRSTGRGKTAQELESSGIREMLALMPTLRRLGSEPMRFADGRDGIVTMVVVPVGPQVRLLQAHVFRVDGEVATQIVINVEESRKTYLEKELLPLVLAFRP
jgi:hypothetical protein